MCVHLSSLSSFQGLMSLTGTVVEFIKVVQKVDNDYYPEVRNNTYNYYVIPRAIVHIRWLKPDAVYILQLKKIFLYADTLPNVYYQCWSWL